MSRMHTCFCCTVIRESSWKREQGPVRKLGFALVLTLVVGVATDTSGSMRWAEEAVARMAYVYTNAGHRIGARTPPTTFVSGWYDFMIDQLLRDYETLVDAGHILGSAMLHITRLRDGATLRAVRVA